MSLRDAALKADRQQRIDVGKAAMKAREDALTYLLQNWKKIWQYKVQPIPNAPKRDAFEYVTNVAQDRIGTQPAHVHGYRFTIGDVDFLYIVGDDRELRVMVTCPDCGVERPSSFHGMADLGRRLRDGRPLYHRCRQGEAKSLAYNIGHAARDANTTVLEIVEEALTHSDVIARAMG